MRIKICLISACLFFFFVGCSTAPTNKNLEKNIDGSSITHKEQSSGSNWEHVLREIKNDNIVNVIDSLKEHSVSGNGEAQFYLGGVYEYGIGGIIDIGKAVDLYTSSASKGYSPAQYRLALAYTSGDIVDKDYSAAYTNKSEIKNTLK